PIEASLLATDSARDAVQEILRRGADTGIFFAGAKSRGFSSELTAQDKEFLRAVSIKPERQGSARRLAARARGLRGHRPAAAPSPPPRARGPPSSRRERRAREGSRLSDVRRPLTRRA